MSGPDENQSPDHAAAEAALFDALRSILAASIGKAPALAKQLEGVDIGAIQSRADLARLPVLRKSDLKGMQEGAPPFGGLVALQPGRAKRLLVSPGPIFEPEGHGDDWWRAAAALRAAGFGGGDIVLNCFSYHLTPGGHIMES